jgi:hypothetical protein
MKITVAVPIERLRKLERQSEMLSQIAAVVRRYARTPETTTLQCVIKMDLRERELTKKLKG